MFTPSSSSPLSFVSRLYLRCIRGGELNAMMLGPYWSSGRFMRLTLTDHNAVTRWHCSGFSRLQAAALDGHRDALALWSSSHFLWQTEIILREAGIFSKETKSPEPLRLSSSLLLAILSNLTHITLHITVTHTSPLHLSVPSIWPHYPTLFLSYRTQLWFKN